MRGADFSYDLLQHSIFLHFQGALKTNIMILVGGQSFQAGAVSYRTL